MLVLDISYYLKCQERHQFNIRYHEQALGKLIDLSQIEGLEQLMFI